MEYMGDILLLALCGLAAYKLIKWLWPIVEQRHNLTALEMAERAILAPGEELEREGTIFGSRKKTLVVSLVNCALLLGVLRLGYDFPAVLWIGFLYQCIGQAVLYIMRVKVGHALVGLNFRHRIVLRIFYAWFWPLYLTQRSK